MPRLQWRPAVSAPCLAMVGIGAGEGLEAITELLRGIPADCGMAFMLVQRHDRADSRALVETLAAGTALAVVEASVGQVIECNHLYVIPNRSAFVIEDGCLALAPPAATTVFEPIDGLFQSLARDQGAWAIGVLLSGEGSDGAAGLQAIKQQGGITFAQDEATARHGGMTQSALDLDCVDFVLPPAGIVTELLRVNRYPYAATAPSQEIEALAAPVPDASDLAELFDLMRDECGIDFNSYKRGTVARRIARRVALKAAPSLPDYVRMVSGSKDEAQALCHDLLIGVTRFFRDPKSYEGLVDVILPWIMAGRRPATPVRIWVPGCASGEEVYSIAICLAEFLGEKFSETPIQIFGTDLSELALAAARAGVFTEESLREVSAERRRKFFTDTGAGWRIAQPLRELCVFARHDLTRDVPFAHIDIISCRNLLMYLDVDSQKNVMPLLHYALDEGGVLIMGSAETAGGFLELFEARDIDGCSFYSRRSVPGRRTPLAQLRRHGERTPAPAGSRDLQVQVDHIAAQRFAPAAVVCDADLNVIEFRGETSPFLLHPPGAPSLNLKNLARPGLMVELAGAVRQARKAEGAVSASAARVEGPMGATQVDLEVVPMLHGAGQQCYLIFFHEHAPPPPWTARLAAAVQPWWQSMRRLLRGESPGAQADESGVAQLQRQLTSLRTHLYEVNQEHDNAIEALQCSREELLSNNQELQSANLELLARPAPPAGGAPGEGQRQSALAGIAPEQARGYADAIVQAMRDPLLLLDESLRVVRGNAAYLRFFNTSAEQIAQCPLYELGGGQWDSPELRTLMYELQDMQREVRDFQVTRNFPGIGAKIISLNAVRLGLPGHSLILMSLVDITDRQLASAQLRTAGQRKDEFLAMLAHELRGPLAPMRNAISILQRGDVLESAAGHARNVLDRQLQKTTRIVDDLLEVARITNGHIALRKERLDLADVVRNALDSARPHLEARQHVLSLRLPDEKLEVIGDAERLDQVITNLLTNAAKYTEPGGTIVLMLDRQGQDAVIRVMDSGAGISAELLPVIFDLFVQEKRALDRSQGGLGIGLTVVREIAELHGGSVSARSSGPGQGSEFTVHLPALPAATPAALADVREAGIEAFTARRILVVDDNVDTATMCAMVLDMEGHQTLTAYDGPSALEAAQKFRPEIVFLDIGLPGMNGYEVARHMRERPETRGAQIVALSGYGRDSDRKESTEAGFNQHLVKPAEVKQLKEAIAAYPLH